MSQCFQSTIPYCPTAQPTAKAHRRNHWRPLSAEKQQAKAVE
ncbi:MAG: hypothetical protein NTZ53_00680 [Cyanobacteria bacterium]|nr:hypothetical protein [Cyanobacteriota bacterium]